MFYRKEYGVRNKRNRKRSKFKNEHSKKIPNIVKVKSKVDKQTYLKSQKTHQCAVQSSI